MSSIFTILNVEFIDLNFLCMRILFDFDSNSSKVSLVCVMSYPPIVYTRTILTTLSNELINLYSTHKEATEI